MRAQYAIFLTIISMLVVFACTSEEIAECVTSSFTFDGRIHPLCGIDGVANRVMIKNLVLNGGTFVIYARSFPDGSGGGEFIFEKNEDNGYHPNKVTAKYRGGGTKEISNSESTSNRNFLIGFFEEWPAVHSEVREVLSYDEEVESIATYILLEIEPNEWEFTGIPASEAFYYKGTNLVNVESVKVFCEEHSH
ncbi:MAG: hypothetical protein N2316_11545 [Spirochaetes bacterium]|nr:hypothetical protein [Spirochaetota bacterium]